MRATSCIVGDFLLAVGAQTGIRLRGRGRGELIDLFDHDEDDKGQNQEVHDGVNEAAVGQDGSTGFFSGLQGGVFLTIKA